MEPEETGQLMLTHSDDDGLTWSEPVNITEQVKDPKWRFVLQGPGRGITMRDGTLVFGAQYQDTLARGRTPYSTILWSKDRGVTWHLGTGARANTTECQPVEVSPGNSVVGFAFDPESPKSAVMTAGGAVWTALRRRAQSSPSDVIIDCVPTTTAKTLNLWFHRKSSTGRVNRLRTSAGPPTIAIRAGPKPSPTTGP